MQTYWDKYAQRHAGFDDNQLKWALEEMYGGCVGITAMNLGNYDPATGFPIASDCFKTLAEATDLQAKWAKDWHCQQDPNFWKRGAPQVYSMRFDNEGMSFPTDPKDGNRVHLGPWFSNAVAHPGTIEFDYAWPGDGRWLDADHYHGPAGTLMGWGSGPGTTTERMTIKWKTLPQWQAQVGPGLYDN
jgi:hypothetical protein